MGSNHSIFPSYKSTVFANPAITVDEISIWKDKVQRLLVFETMANTLKPAKKHYDQVCESVNSHQLRTEERYLQSCQISVLSFGFFLMGSLGDFGYVANISYEEN